MLEEGTQKSSSIDVARCFKFMEEKEEIRAETFNLTKDTLTVKEVAEVCKKHNPKITLKETNDEVQPWIFFIKSKIIKHRF